MLDHALVINAKEVRQAITVALIPHMSDISAREKAIKVYDDIINGTEEVSSDRIKRDREKLRAILAARGKNNAIKRHT